MIKDKLFGRSSQVDKEIKYPIRFSDEMQLGPGRMHIESASDISEKIHEGIGMVK